MKAISFKVFHGYTLIGYLTFLSIIGSSFDVLCQGFGDNRLLFSINPESYFSLRYSYDSIQDKHSMKLNRGASQIFSPSILSIVDSLQCIGGIYNSLSSHSGDYLLSMFGFKMDIRDPFVDSSYFKIVVGDPFIDSNLQVIDLFDDLDDKSKEDLKSCWVLDGNTSLKVNLNDSLFIFLNTNNCVWYQHFGSNSMIRDSAEYYFRGKKVNQQALLTNGGYYETLVPKLWRVRSDNSLELMEKSLSDQLIIEGMFTSIPILVKHSDGKRWWILLPRANSTQAAVYLTSHESLEYSHESYYPSISPSPQDYQYTFRNYLEGDICSVSPLGNYLAFYRYINHADYNGELSVYQFDRCTGKIGTLFAQYFIPIQKLESTKQLMHPILTYKDRVMRDERIEKMISSMVLVAREIGLNHSIDSLQWYSYEREIFFSPKEDQIIFKDPNLNYIHCKLSQNGDFGSSCRVLNDTFIKNSIFRKEFDETNQVRWSDLTQLPNFDLLLSNYINHKSNNTIEEEHVAIKFSANPNQNPTFSSLLQERRLVGEPWMHHFQPTQSHPMYPIHYRMPPLARDCISVIPDEPKFNLFPNPTSGQFYIESNDKDIYFQSLEIYSMSGIKVHERALDPRQVYQGINEDISNVPQGLYIVLLRDIFGSARFRGKLVKIN